MKPRVATWRYQRGSRSLAANLLQTQPVESQELTSVNDEDDYDVPEEIEEVLDEILQALRDKNREVQYIIFYYLNNTFNSLISYYQVLCSKGHWTTYESPVKELC